MNSSITAWAVKHHVSYTALMELQAIFGLGVNSAVKALDNDHSETYLQSMVRLEAARKGIKLWRNNVGVLLNEKGTPVRYGLANDSKRLNEIVKSGDLIGWRPILITQAHLGHTIAQFLSRECKRSNWTYSGTAHEIAQLKWAQAVNADGGDASFCTREGSL